MADIPDFNGNVSDQYYHSQLNASLNSKISDNGFAIPPQTTTSATSLLDSQPLGTMWYDSENHRWLGNRNGVLVEIPSNPV